MKAIGIDLGTTNSAVAEYKPDQKRASVLVNGDGKPLTPSVVGVRIRNGEHTRLIGGPALNWAKREPKDTIVSVKRLMGRDYADADVADARGRLSYRIVPGPDQDPRAHVMIAGTAYTPAQVSTMILEKLKQDATDRLGRTPTHAVITVPAYFREAQRAATRAAGEAAGLVVKRIIDEPTAAAIAFGVDLQPGERRRILVYDLGGGTFDISILYATKDSEGNNHFQVLDFAGDNWLGGDDFDLLVVDRIIEWIKQNAGVDPSEDLKFRFTAKQEAELAKRELSQAAEVDIIVPAALRADGGTVVDVDMTLSRAEFEEMIEPLVARTIRLVRDALERQSLRPDDISDVLLVGGSTLTPKVYQTVESFFGKQKVRRNINPMECVAIGAGILAGTTHGMECVACQKINDDSADVCAECGHSLATARPTGDTNVYDVTGMALGVGAVHGAQADTFVPIIPKGTPYNPMTEPMRRTFEATDGRLIRVPVYEGDAAVASQNHEQGVIEYELPEQIDVHTRVDVEFVYDKNRELSVTITVPGTANRYQTKLRTDTQRTNAAASAEPEEDGATYREDLAFIEEATRMFLRRYEQYLEPAHAMKITQDLERAQRTLVFSDPAECRFMTSVLQSDIYSAGLASDLYYAERTADQAAPEDAEKINQAIAAIRRSHQEGRRDTAMEQARLLKPVLARVGQQNAVAEIVDAEEFDGLLKLLDREP
ncbi:Hsp70 family protein [Streptomyces sp. NPDC059255]|uniref:Hsp70 family protein n=1 Tax=Streptomyces sp. NPDC059255 TaxID=3346793 RepID=UPI003694D475